MTAEEKCKINVFQNLERGEPLTVPWDDNFKRFFIKLEGTVVHFERVINSEPRQVQPDKMDILTFGITCSMYELVRKL
jgi:hypothetical protein